MEEVVTLEEEVPGEDEVVAAAVVVVAEEEDLLGMDQRGDLMVSVWQTKMSKFLHVYISILHLNSGTHHKSRENESESMDDSEDEHLDDVDDSASDDEEEQPAARPYMALLQSFNDTSAPTAKRRKLGHNEASNPTENSRDEKMDDSGDEERDDVDEVDEVEDAENDDDQLEEEPDSEDEEELTDPFDVHFAHPNDQDVGLAVKAIKNDEWATKRALVSSLRATIMSAGSSSKIDIPQPCGTEGLKLKQKLQETSAKKVDKLDNAQKAILPLLFGYKDIFHCDRTVKNSTGLRQAACLHALNHVFK